MKTKLAITIFALIEIMIGSIALMTVILSLIKGLSTKPPEVFIFVLVTAFTSAVLGFGILKGNLASYHLLLYFSSTIILSKILVFARIITLNGALETSIPSSIKNAISILYHGLLIFYFTRKSVRTQFGERRNVIFSLKRTFKNDY
jgi:hypothetical protein